MKNKNHSPQDRCIALDAASDASSLLIYTGDLPFEKLLFIQNISPFLIGFDLHNHLADLIQDIGHLYTLFRIDGIKATSGGISRDKQVIKFCNTSNRRRVCIFSRNETTI